MKSTFLLRTSTVCAFLLLIAAPLHAVAYLRTPEGEAGAIDWAPSAYRLAPELWNWSHPQTVYLAYGRVTSILLVGALLGLVAMHRLQPRPESTFERWAFRVFAVGYALLGAGSIAEYYTPFLEQAFMFITLPGTLITLVGGVLFGIASSRRKIIRPALAIFLALSFLPGVPVLVAILGHIPIAFSLVMLGLITAGLSLASRSNAPTNTEALPTFQ